MPKGIAKFLTQSIANANVRVTIGEKTLLENPENNGVTNHD